MEISSEGKVVVRRKDTNAVVFVIRDFLYRSDGYVEVHTEDYSTKWGMGERFQNSFHIRVGLWTVYNRDRFGTIDSGSYTQSGQSYGYHPVYLAKSLYENTFHLVYFKTTYGFNL